MGADQQIDWAGTAVSVLDWWRDAGVDVVVADEPRDWLERVPPRAAEALAEVAPPAALPDTLDAFAAWRIGAHAPEGAGGVLAEGDPTAPLMIVTDCPEGDGLIGGAPGRLFDRMLAAIGHSRGSVYVAALCTVRPLGGRVAPELTPRLAELLLHHIGLVAPQRLLMLGQAPSRALTGTDAVAGRRNLHAINLKSGTVDAVASLHPRFLIENPRMKGEAWKDLQLLMGGRR